MDSFQLYGIERNTFQDSSSVRMTYLYLGLATPKKLMTYDFIPVSSAPLHLFQFKPKQNLPVVIRYEYMQVFLFWVIDPIQLNAPWHRK
jgi:hypothetical protein